MNHCRDCNSDYTTPGTCNCFAVGGKRHAAPYVPYIPYVPYTPVYPWVQPWFPQITWSNPSTITVSTAPNIEGTTTTTSLDNVARSFTAGGSCAVNS